MKATSDSLIQILSEINHSVSGKELKVDDDLFKKGILDSLTVVQLIISLEKKFSIKISNKDISYKSFTTIKNIEELVNSKQQ